VKRVTRVMKDGTAKVYEYPNYRRPKRCRCHTLMRDGACPRGCPPPDPRFQTKGRAL